MFRLLSYVELTFLFTFSPAPASEAIVEATLLKLAPGEAVDFFPFLNFVERDDFVDKAYFFDRFLWDVGAVV